MEETTEKLQPVDLRDYPSILSQENTWYLIDKEAGIWFTTAIPGTDGKSENDLTKLYRNFKFCLCFGTKVEIAGINNRPVTSIDIGGVMNVSKIIDTIDACTDDDSFMIVKDNDDFYLCTKLEDRLIMQKIVGTVLFTTEDSSYIRQRFENLSMGHALRIPLDATSGLMKVTNSTDELFRSADEPLEKEFLDAFYDLYDQYIITNRGCSTDDVLRKLAEKLF